METPPATQCWLAVLAEDRPGVIARIVTTITGSGNEIEELSVTRAGNGILRVQLLARGPRAGTLSKRLFRLVHVLKVLPLPEERRYVHTMRLGVCSAQRAEVVALLDLFGGRVLTVDERSLLIEASGVQEHLDGLRRLLEPFRILDAAQLPAPTLTQQSGHRAPRAVTRSGS